MIKVFNLKNLDCPNCAAKMECAVNKINAVNHATVNYLSQKMMIDADDAQFDNVMKQVVKVCKKIEPDCKVIL